MKSLMGRTWAFGTAGLLLGSLLVTSAEAARGGGPPGMSPRGVSRGHVGTGSGHPPRAWRGGGGHNHGGWGHKGGWGHSHGHHHGGWGYRGWGWWPGGFAVGVGVGAALTAPWWGYGYPAVYAAPAYPYAYPAPPVYTVPSAMPYGYPAYPAPPPPPPAPESAPPAEPSGSSTLPPTPGLSTELSAPPPGAVGAPAGAPPPHAATGAGCETVTVVGHWQTRVYPDGQRMTVWVPTSTRSICR